MWHVLETKLKALLTLFMAGIFFYLDYKGVTRESTGSWGYASVVVSMMIGAIFTLGKNKLWWRFLWNSPRVPLLVRRYLNGLCPDLNGEWKGEIRSNFSLTQPGGELDPPIEILAEIDAGWLGISMKLKTKRPQPDENGDWYSKSRTQVVVLEKNKLQTDKAEGSFLLWYVYFNETQRPLPTDQNSHIGAALLGVTWENDKPILRGHYWADRCWHGCADQNNTGKIFKNTAGIVKLYRS